MDDTRNLGQVLVVDEYGNRHLLREEVSRGGQGVVYRTADTDLAVKLWTKRGGEVLESAENVRELFENVRVLPLPERLPISLPHAVLRDAPGYVMTLLSEMDTFWKMIPRGDSFLEQFKEYAATGSTSRRLFALAQCSAILARLHAAGLVYCDVSPNNVFVSRDELAQVWLIDCDNLRFETSSRWGIGTPSFMAPELKASGVRPRTDSWSFAVMAFQVLCMLHPFSRQISDRGWDSDDASTSEDREIQAPNGDVPYVDDETDGSNRAVDIDGRRVGLPRDLVLTPELRRLFQETLGVGRLHPWRRPSLSYWAVELMRAHDLSIPCSNPGCLMSYFVEETRCPWCDAAKPIYVMAESRYWKMVFQVSDQPVRIPHRLVAPFSLRVAEPSSYKVEVDKLRSRVVAARGSDPLPNDVKFQFVGLGT